MMKENLSSISLQSLNYKMKAIDLSQNKIKVLPSEILLLSNLTHLNLKSNLLEFLPDDQRSRDGKSKRTYHASPNIRRANTMSWINLSKLEDLNISDNKIIRLPDSLGFCSKLKNLLINSNKLCDIPASFSELTNLESLNFEWFMYLDPPQQQYQKQEQGQFVIQQLRDFCKAAVEIVGFNQRERPSNRFNQDQRSFSAFLCYFHICIKTKKNQI